MAHIISDFGILPKVSHKTQTLSCMKISQEPIQNRIYDAEGIQKRINAAAEQRARLDDEIKKRYEDIKHINFLG